ncbi:MAG TPA: aminotransferase class I/II-fold pyridoxal phosphate-dependent enzyme [Solirubrobacteraceae bacterium]|nr:aminotransferase class I/II-fold pyridoxal phosphate-dependent enzyme [Solirubrobacteraceae bacterium]
MVELSVPSLPELRRRRSEKWALYEPDVLSLTIAEMDFPVAAPIRDAIIDAIDRSDFGYAVSAPGALFEALAAFARRRLSWTIDPEQVTVVPDVMVGLVEICRRVAAPGEAVAFATPAYPPFFRELGAAGLRIVEIPLGRDGALDLDVLDQALKDGIRALVLANPHNPTGRVLPRGELEAIADRCAAAQTWVLADEIHAPLTLPGARHLPWLEVSDAARRHGISLTSASKAFNLAALKTAFIVTAGQEARALVSSIGSQHDHASLFGQIAAEVAFGDGDAWLDAAIGQLDRNRAQLGADLAEMLPQISWRAPQATYLAWLDCAALGMGDDPAAGFLERGRVAVSPGLDYGPPGAGHVRLNFATSPEHLTEAVRRMRTAIDR